MAALHAAEAAGDPLARPACERCGGALELVEAGWQEKLDVFGLVSVSGGLAGTPGDGQARGCAQTAPRGSPGWPQQAPRVQWGPIPGNTLPPSRVPWFSWISMVLPKEMSGSLTKNRSTSWGSRVGFLAEGFLWPSPLTWLGRKGASFLISRSLGQRPDCRLCADFSALSELLPACCLLSLSLSLSLSPSLSFSLL